MIVRQVDKAIAGHFERYQQVLVLLGARQVGKTTLLRRLFPEAQYLSVDNEPIKSALEKYDPAVYRQLLVNNRQKLAVIDEIHRLSDPGRAAKIFFDQIGDFRLIVTGSSSFRIKNKTSESLAGRKIDYRLYPLTFNEYLVQSKLEPKLLLGKLGLILAGEKPAAAVKTYDRQAILSKLLVYGTYPAMLNHPTDAQYLENLIDSVIFRDLLDLSLLENKAAALGLLKLLAYQIGSLVNYAELAAKLNINAVTVKRYIELFRQSFIIFPLKPFTTRQRDEIAKMPKIYFYDNGLRNALINNFEPFESRGDAGQLWENFAVTEILKENDYDNSGCQLNFWRTKSGSEVDLVVSRGGQKTAVEIKIQPKRINQAFVGRYPGSKMAVVTMENW